MMTVLMVLVRSPTNQFSKCICLANFICLIIYFPFFHIAGNHQTLEWDSSDQQLIDGAGELLYKLRAKDEKIVRVNLWEICSDYSNLF